VLRIKPTRIATMGTNRTDMRPPLFFGVDFFRLRRIIKKSLVSAFHGVSYDTVMVVPLFWESQGDCVAH